MIYTENFYQSLFIEPLQNNTGKHLSVVTGYSHPDMVARHFKDLKDEKLHKEFSLDLVIGMGNVSSEEHGLFNRLMTTVYPEQFKCYYALNKNRFHSKVYQWSNDDEQKLSYMGSANYSQAGIINNAQQEVLTTLDNCFNQTIEDYISKLKDESILCTDVAAIELLKKTKKRDTPEIPQLDTTVRNGSEASISPYNGMEGLRVSLLDRNGGTGEASRFNWGQSEARRKLGRELNQAYMAISQPALRLGFFPPKKSHFILEDINDKNTIWLALMGGQGGKNLETHENNSIMGIHFRNVLGVPLGEKVLPEHHINYGKTYIDFYKKDEDHYYFDF